MSYRMATRVIWAACALVFLIALFTASMAAGGAISFSALMVFGCISTFAWLTAFFTWLFWG